MRMISERAAQWHHLYEEGNPSPAQDREYLQWLTRSPRHVAEALRIGLIDLRLRRMARDKVFGNVPSPKIIPFPQPAVRRGEPEISRIERPPTTARQVLKAAGLVFGAVLLMMLVRVVSVDQTVTTASGQWTKSLLDEGSLAHVAPNSELRTHFSEEWRSLALARGEAMFDVAKDPGRPFVVSTALGTVTAVGTHFGISNLKDPANLDDRVIITVSEGEVAVRPRRPGEPANPAQSPISLKANQQLVLSALSPPRLLDPVDAVRELKWLQGWVEADGDTVAQMVRELNRRNQAQIVIDDPVVSNLRIMSLGFKPSQPEVLVERANGWYADYHGKSAGRKGGVALRLERP